MSIKRVPSDSCGAVVSVDRRSGQRTHTVLKVGRAIAAQDAGLARIRNISDRGASLQLQIPVQSGDALTLELADGVLLQGTIVWSSSGRAGVLFDQEIDSADLLQRLAAHTKSGHVRPVRLPLSVLAVVRSERGTYRAALKDISQRGMKLEHRDWLVEGLQVTVTLPSGLERRGVIRWTNDAFAGVMLLDPFSPQDLGSAKSL